MLSIEVIPTTPPGMLPAERPASFLFCLEIPMSTIDTNNRMETMLDNAFSRFDRNQDKKLDSEEYKSFYEILRNGIAMDKNNQPVVSDKQFFERMDHNGDGGVSNEEMHSTNFLMRADLCDPSLDKMIAWLREQSTEAATLAAQLLASEPQPNPSIATDAQPTDKA
jgi:Ca2+-binding EF-hand superfamily protein